MVLDQKNGSCCGFLVISDINGKSFICVACESGLT